MNISLIGMMGSGKTTIAKLLTAKLTGYSFVDTDTLISETEKMSINDIFRLKGEAYFRIVEQNILNNILQNTDNNIISTGGGIVLSDINIAILLEKSTVFYLKASEETIYNRVKNNNERPLLNTENLKEKIQSILNNRKSKYEIAHYIIDTDNKTPDEVATEIIRKLSENGKS